MVKKLDELKQEPRDPDSLESIKIKDEFWKKMSEHLEHTKNMIEGWVEEARKNETK
jgi:hypothetical protein